MSPDWACLPLLPLRCILDHLSTEDAVAAMSVCRHWRSAVLLYEGRKECLKLEAKHLDKCLYLTRLFRKHTNKLHIYLDCNEEELDKFMSYVLPQYFDTIKLHDLVFIGPKYTLMSPLTPIVKLKRIITESLIHKHSLCLRKLALLGCEMGVVKNENDKFIHKHLEYYSRPLTFPSVTTPADAILTRPNAALMLFSTLRRLIVDYEQISTDALETLSELRSFDQLTLNVVFKEDVSYRTIDWDRLDACYPNGLEVSMNLIEVPVKKMDEVMHTVFQEGMNLTSLKIFYCKIVYQPILETVVQLYKDTIKELVWADCPLDSTSSCARIGVECRQLHQIESLINVNPFVLLCWQCKYLQRLVIHGYWIWQYDLVGFARLRKSLCSLEVSALHSRQDLFGSSDPVARVLVRDPPRHVPEHFVKEMNEYTRFKWKPISFNKLHPGLRARASSSDRASYVLQETMQHLGVT